MTFYSFNNSHFSIKKFVKAILKFTHSTNITLKNKKKSCFTISNTLVKFSN